MPRTMYSKITAAKAIYLDIASSAMKSDRKKGNLVKAKKWANIKEPMIRIKII